MSYLGMKNDGLYAFANGEEIFIGHYEKNGMEYCQIPITIQNY